MSSHAAKINLLSGLNIADDYIPLSECKVKIHLSFEMFHYFTDASSDAVKAFIPSGLIQALTTASSWSSNIANSFPVLAQ